jgi:hypothetical protein
VKQVMQPVAGGCGAIEVSRPTTGPTYVSVRTGWAVLRFSEGAVGVVARSSLAGRAEPLSGPDWTRGGGSSHRQRISDQSSIAAAPRRGCVRAWPTGRSEQMSALSLPAGAAAQQAEAPDRQRASASESIDERDHRRSGCVSESPAVSRGTCGAVTGHGEPSRAILPRASSTVVERPHPVAAEVPRDAAPSDPDAYFAGC